MKDKQIRRMTLLIESLHKPDPALRNCAHNQECFHELLGYRDEVLDYCHRRLKEIQNQ